MSIVVKTAKINPDCEGCTALQQSLKAEHLLVVDALKKIHQQAEQIERLQQQVNRLQDRNSTPRWLL